MGKNRKPVIILIAVLGLIYILLMSVSFTGWGYAGYRGYSRGPSFWYFGGPAYYYNRSMRPGSIGGTRGLGGGPGSGK